MYFSAIHHALCPSPRQCPSPLELNLEFVSNTQDTAVASRPLSDLTGSRTPTPSTRSSRLPHGLRVDRQRRSGLASTGNARALITPHSSPRPACLYHYSLCLAVRTPAADTSDSCVFAVVIARRVHAAVCPRLHSAMRGWSGSPCAASLGPSAPSGRGRFDRRAGRVAMTVTGWAARGARPATSCRRASGRTRPAVP